MLGQGVSLVGVLSQLIDDCCSVVIGFGNELPLDLVGLSLGGGRWFVHPLPIIEQSLMLYHPGQKVH